MKFRCCSFNQMALDIKEANERIVMFGAGVVGQITVPQILEDYNITVNVDCFLDNDSAKWGSTIRISGTDYIVKSPRYLYECDDNTVILINISRFVDVKQQLEAMECTRGMTAYIIPMMCIHNMCTEKSRGNPYFMDRPAIAKKIHYMWLGKKSIPENLQKCIDTWYKYCPDYEIIEWNENNYNIEKHPYMKQAYEAKAYGFVPDYARIDILYNEGGIYMDTDVELIKNLDDMLFQEAFCGVEKWQVINFGGCSGSIKGHPMLKRFLDARENVYYLNSDGSQNRNTCGFYDTKTAIQAGYKLNGMTQCINGMNIYAYDYFQPYDYMSGLCNITEHTYSIHQFNGGWMDDAMKEQNRITSQKYLELYKQCLVK